MSRAVNFSETQKAPAIAGAFLYPSCYLGGRSHELSSDKLIDTTKHTREGEFQTCVRIRTGGNQAPGQIFLL